MDDIENLDLEDLYSEKEYRLEEQDLRILKAILSEKDIAKEFVSIYDESLFVGDARPFAKFVIDYTKTYKSVPTKRIILEENGLNSDFEYIYDQIQSVEFNKEEFRYDLNKLKTRYTKGKVETLRSSINNIDLESDIDWETTTRKFRNQIDDIDKIRRGQRAVYTQKTLKEYMPEFRDDYARKVKNPQLGQGILTGYSFLDYVTNGLFGSQLVIITASSGMGKSFFLNNMAIQMWMQKNTIHTKKRDFEKGYNILYFSLEMPFESCVRRTMARLADLPIYGLRDCKIGTDKIDRLNDAANFIHRYPYDFEIVDIPRGVTVDQIEDRLNESISKGRSPDVVVIDYLGLMETFDIEGDDWLRLGYIAGGIHELARVYNIVALTAVQLNKPPQGKNQDSADLIGMHRIGRSSLIIHHANIGIQIENRKNEHQYGDLVYHLIKNRDGQLGSHTISKRFSHATLKDNEDNIYEPPDEDDDEINTVLANQADEDISARLEKLGWYDPISDEDPEEDESQTGL